mgnify:CR=1 FL=1
MGAFLRWLFDPAPSGGMFMPDAKSATPREVFGRLILEVRSDQEIYARFEYLGALPPVGSVILTLRGQTRVEVLEHKWLLVSDALICTIIVREVS